VDIAAAETAKRRIVTVALSTLIFEESSAEFGMSSLGILISSAAAASPTTRVPCDGFEYPEDTSVKLMHERHGRLPVGGTHNINRKVPQADKWAAAEQRLQLWKQM
jgi:hypothetical protein